MCISLKTGQIGSFGSKKILAIGGWVCLVSDVWCCKQGAGETKTSDEGLWLSPMVFCVLCKLESEAPALIVSHPVNISTEEKGSISLSAMPRKFSTA